MWQQGINHLSFSTLEYFTGTKQEINNNFTKKTKKQKTKNRTPKRPEQTNKTPQKATTTKN